MKERVVVVVEVSSPNRGRDLDVKETRSEDDAKAGSWRYIDRVLAWYLSRVNHFSSFLKVFIGEALV